MLWVVIGHSPLSVTAFASSFDADCHECALFLKKVAYSFHMPLFIMISGYLFYITRIDKGASYRKTLTDKFKRLGIPYLFFTVFAFFLKCICRGSREAGHLIVEILCQCLCSAIRGPVARDVVRGSCPALLFLVGSV